MLEKFPTNFIDYCFMRKMILKFSEKLIINALTLYLTLNTSKYSPDSFQLFLQSQNTIKAPQLYLNTHEFSFLISSISKENRKKARKRKINFKHFSSSFISILHLHFSVRYCFEIDGNLCIIHFPLPPFFIRSLTMFK